MKRLSLLKKIALGTGAVAAVTPIALMSTSCAIEEIYADYITFDSIRNNYDYSGVVRSDQTYKRLLFGSRKVNNGNYVLIYGSNMYSEVCNFFSGDASNRDRNAWFTNCDETHPEGRFNLSPFYYGIQRAFGDTKFQNFGIFNVIDAWNGKVYDTKGHEIKVSENGVVPLEVISPWMKWTEPMIQQTKLFNKSEYVEKPYDWNEKSVSVKSYIRNDKSAVLFREFCKTGAKVYPKTKDRTKTFDTSDNNKASGILVFKDGKLQTESKDKKADIFEIPQTKDAWYDFFKKYFWKDDSK